MWVYSYTSAPPITAAKASFPARNKFTYTSYFEKLRNEVSAIIGTGTFSSTPYADVNAFQTL